MARSQAIGGGDRTRTRRTRARGPGRRNEAAAGSPPTWPPARRAGGRRPTRSAAGRATRGTAGGRAVRPSDDLPASPIPIPAKGILLGALVRLRLLLRLGSIGGGAARPAPVPARGGREPRRRRALRGPASAVSSTPAAPRFEDVRAARRERVSSGAGSRSDFERRSHEVAKAPPSALWARRRSRSSRPGRARRSPERPERFGRQRRPVKSTRGPRRLRGPPGCCTTSARV